MGSSGGPGWQESLRIVSLTLEREGRASLPGGGASLRLARDAKATRENARRRPPRPKFYYPLQKIAACFQIDFAPRVATPVLQSRLTQPTRPRLSLIDR